MDVPSLYLWLQDSAEAKLSLKLSISPSGMITAFASWYINAIRNQWRQNIPKTTLPESDSWSLCARFVWLWDIVLNMLQNTHFLENRCQPTPVSPISWTRWSFHIWWKSNGRPQKFPQNIQTDMRPVPVGGDLTSYVEGQQFVRIFFSFQ